MSVLIFVIGILCVNLAVSQNTYRLAVATSSGLRHSSYSDLIKEAGYLNADIIVLPTISANAKDYYEVTKSISSSAKSAGVYVAAYVLEKTKCQDKEEELGSSLIFDRQGEVVAIYQKPCTGLSPQIPEFSTDFGVTFGLLMSEDLGLREPGSLELTNYLVAGGLNGSKFASSWSFKTKANLLTAFGVVTGGVDYMDTNLNTDARDVNVTVVSVNKDGGEAHTEYTTNPTLAFPNEDLSRYIIRPLDLQAAVGGQSQTVCHEEFCCDFYVKASYAGASQREVSYGLAAFNGVRHFAGGHNIGAQSCAVVACTGLDKRSCSLALNSTEAHFEKINISGNFNTENSAQFPLLVANSQIYQKPKHNITFNSENSKATIENGRNLLNFGIFARDYSKGLGSLNEFGIYYDYFVNENVQDFFKNLFDYLWIRVKILLFIVSIYVLEMM